MGQRSGRGDRRESICITGFKRNQVGVLMDIAKLKRHLGPRLQGWLISVLLHIVAAALLVWLSLGDSGPKQAEYETAQASVMREEPPEPIEPLVEDLQVDRWQGAAELSEPMVLPSELDMGSVGDGSGDVIAVAGLIGPGTGGQGRAAVDGRTRFCGTSGSGKRICFVVDHSLSMVMAHDYVRDQLQLAIERLTPGHYYNVIYYAEGEPVQLAPGELIRANGPNRQRGMEFVANMELAQTVASGQGWQAVVNALEAAFAGRNVRGQGVDLIYLLTDGEYDREQVLSRLRQMQAGQSRPVTISVVACGSRDSEAFLRELATSYNGEYRFLTDEETTSMGFSELDRRW